jgi:hypothetical protein
MCETLITRCNDKPLAEDFRLSDAWLQHIDDTLEMADSLTALSLSTRCPVCEAENDIPLDLESRLLTLLATRQLQFLEHIHLIASVYHWSEQDVMQLPAARRNFYITRITGEVGV